MIPLKMEFAIALQVKRLLLAGLGLRGWGREVLELVWSLPCLAVADLLPWRKGLEVAMGNLVAGVRQTRGTYRKAWVSWRGS